MKTLREFMQGRGWLRGGIVCAGLMLLLASRAWAPTFTAGPSVRVTPNVQFGANQIEFKWIMDVAWLGKLEIFNNPDATGAPWQPRGTSIRQIIR